MKKMNKILTTVLVIALAALTLAGCTKKDASPVTTDGSTSMERSSAHSAKRSRKRKALT